MPVWTRLNFKGEWIFIAETRSEFTTAAIEEGEDPRFSNVSESGFVLLDARSRVIKSRSNKPNGEIVYT